MRVAASVTCDEESRKTIERWGASRAVEARLVERARIVLRCLAGERNDRIAAQMNLRPNTVAKWRGRFIEMGVAGLRDQPRPGKPPKYDVGQLRTRILKQLEMPAPDGQSSWDGVTLARALDVSDDVVWRILSKEGISLQRMRSWVA